MKKSIKLSTIFACVIMFILSLFMSVSLFVTPASAAGGSVFEMEYGASVKLTGNGLRFKAKMDKGYYDMITTNDTADKVELWGYIAPVEEFDKVGGSYKDLAVKVGGQLAEDKIYEKDGYYYANIAITDLDQFQKEGKYLYNRSFSAIMFIVDRNTATPVYTYAEFAKGADGISDIQNQTRTQYQVVNAAFLDATESYSVNVWQKYNGWFTSESNPVMLCTEQEYKGFVANARANGGELANKLASKKPYVFVSKEVRAAANGYAANDKLSSAISYNPVLQNAGVELDGHVVSYYDGYRLVEQYFVADGANAPAPADPVRDGYVFAGWSGNATSVTEARNIYAKWKAAKGDVKDLGNMSVYGVTLGSGAAINTDNDVLNQRVVLSSGDLGDGAYYPGDGNPTDKANTADQAFLAYDGNYGFNDYFVADFTGKNMPMLAFFANNYDKSVFYGNGTKNGVVVATGLTWPDGRLFAEDTAYCTSVFNGQGLCMWGPHMIYNTAKNDNSKGVLLHSNVSSTAIGRANLVDGKQYRVIMGMQPGDDASNKAIKLTYLLYDLDEGQIVEFKEINTYNFFADGWANAGQTRDQFCQGSIVAYGYFGTPTVLDKTYPIYEDTTVAAVVDALGMPAMPTTYNATVSGDQVTLGKSSLGDGANYTIGQNNGGYVNQSYYAINGNYDMDDYVAFDFTGKNMPEIAFFAKNYNNSMYAEGTSKQGIVVVTGITTWDGQLTSGVNGNGTQINYGFPYMIQDAADGGFIRKSFKASALGRANLADDTHYRVIMGFEGKNSEGTNGITLHWYLYNLDTNQVVEQSSIETWNFFSGSNAKVGNMKVSDLSGAIVLYGKFGATCTIDKLHGVYQDTTIEDVAAELSAQSGLSQCTVSFYNYDGSLLSEEVVVAGDVPTYNGETPVRYGDVLYSSYTFTGWDKEFAAVTEDTSYTAVYTGTLRDDVTFSGNAGHTYGVEQSGEKIILKKSNLGNNANYAKGQQNADGAYVHQSYVALDGNYNLNDYVAFDFTGKNLPEIAFFAKNYNDSMYAEGTSKQGIVVVTGITTWDGQLTSGVNSNGTQINYGFPYMIQNAADGGFCQSAFKNSALGRANLVDGTHYRVIMGFTGSGSAITLNWYLYNLDTNAVVEQSSMTTWNFFTGSNAQVGNMKIDDLSGSIVLYGKFGVACTIDKLYGVFTDTNIDAIATNLNKTAYTVTFQNADGEVLQQETVAYGAVPAYKGATPTMENNTLFAYNFKGWDRVFAPVTSNVVYTACYEEDAQDNITFSNVSANGDGLVLNKGSLGDGANYMIGQNNGGYVNQAYFGLDGNYGLNDFVAFDFTGKNLPEIAFFAKNYNNSMYAEGTSKQGIVVVTGITTWDGQLTSGVNSNGTQINYGFPYMIQNAADGGFCQGAMKDSALGRANLVDGTQYRVIMGFTGSGSAITLHWYLYNLDTNTVVEQSSMTTWNFFTGSNDKVGNMKISDLSGSIVLYGKFGTTCTIDTLWGVYEDTTLDGVVSQFFPTDDGEVPTTNAPDYSQYDDQFDFYAYGAHSDGTYTLGGEEYYVGMNLSNLKQYSLYGQAGFTIYFPQSDFLIDGTASSLNNAKKLIDDLAKVGIYKTILTDNRIMYLSLQEKAIVGSGCQFANEDALDEFIYNCVKDYATYPGVYGIQLGDEPKYACLSAYAAVYNSLKRVNEKYGYNLFIQYNLNPLNVSENVYNNYYPEVSGTYEWNNYRYKLGLRSRYDDAMVRYQKYVKDFLDAMQPDSIMYDDYPLHEDKNGDVQILDSFIPCLQFVAKEASNRGIAFYMVTQAHENNASGMIHKREVTEAGAEWLNNILLGFGAKQIAYYTYYTRGESDLTGGESYVDGESFVDYNGNPTDLYYTMQEIMANNQKFAPTILQFEYQGSRYYKGSSVSSNNNHVSKITQADNFQKLTGFSVDKEHALVTELYDEENGYYMYMAMNIVDPDLAGDYTQTMTMTFNGYSNVLVYRDGVATPVALDGNTLTVTVAPGEAVYVIPYN